MQKPQPELSKQGTCPKVQTGKVAGSTTYILEAASPLYMVDPG